MKIWSATTMLKFRSAKAVIVAAMSACALAGMAHAQSKASASGMKDHGTTTLSSMSDGVIHLTMVQNGKVVDEAYVFIEDAAPNFAREAALQSTIGANFRAIATDMTGFMLSSSGESTSATVEHNAFMNAKSDASSTTLLVAAGSSLISASGESSGDAILDRMKQCNLEANGVYSQCLSEVNNDPTFQACNAECEKKFPWTVNERGNFPTRQDRENYEQWSQCTARCRESRPVNPDGTRGPSILDRREECKKKRDAAFSACWRRTAPAAN